MEIGYLDKKRKELDSKLSMLEDNEEEYETDDEIEMVGDVSEETENAERDEIEVAEGKKSYTKVGYSFLLESKRRIIMCKSFLIARDHNGLAP